MQVFGNRLGLDPGDGALIVAVEEGSRVGEVGCAEVAEEVSEGDDHLPALAYGFNFTLADTLAGALFADAFPVDGASHVGGEIAKQGLDVLVTTELDLVGFRM